MLKQQNKWILANDWEVEEAEIVSGEFHNHTCISPDVSEEYMRLENVLNVVFREDLDKLPAEAGFPNDCGDAYDFFMTADHFRMSPRTPDCEYQLTAAWRAIAQQIIKYNELKACGKYPGKLYYPGFEWDMPGFDHATIALIADGKEVPVEGIRAFEWLYSSACSKDLFDMDEEASFGTRLNKAGQDKELTFEALAWIKEHYPNSFFSLNHPSAKKATKREIKIADIRRLHDLAPEIFFSFEGLPGNQFSGDRGEYPWVYGGADYILAQVGGVWDALLAEGRHIFVLANSDFHFKISSNGLYSSGYWPSEYARNYFPAKGDNFLDIIRCLREGNSLAVLGNLISALEFSAKEHSDDENSVPMGSDLYSQKGKSVELKIRFKEEQNILEHIDLIAGLMSGRADDYTTDSNPSTRVLHRFKREEWGEPDAEGFYELRYKIKVEQSMYFRLRGTNLAPNTEGFTDSAGNPLKDKELIKSHYTKLAYFHKLINERNYRNLWFYSNPIFVHLV